MPAVTTPFRADHSIDFEAHDANLRHLLDAGATGVVAAGCTGEFWALDFEERRRLAEATVRVMRGRGPAIIGAGAIQLAEVAELSAAAGEAGADAILVMPPYFVHATPSEIVAHFEAVDRSTAVPIVLYNIPGNAGNWITPDLVDELADLDNVVAIKESSGDWNNFHKTLIRVRDRIRVFCGPSSVFGVPAVLAGADGLIDCFPNVWAPGGLDLWYAAHEGRMDEAFALQKTGIALTELFVADGRTLYPSTKAAMNHLGLAGGGVPRPPLLPLEGAPLRDFCAALDELLPRVEDRPALKRARE